MTAFAAKNIKIAGMRIALRIPAVMAALPN
jgi:hypothetical protein